MEPYLNIKTQLETNNPLNRHIIAKEKISAHEQIIKTNFLISVVSDKKRSIICDGCFLHQSKLQPCKKCKTVYFCSKNCEEIKWNKEHKFECEILSKIKESLKACIDPLFKALIVVIL